MLCLFALLSEHTDSKTQRHCCHHYRPTDVYYWHYAMFQLLITVGLAFTVRRKHLFPNCCWQRPGFLQWEFSVWFSQYSLIFDNIRSVVVTLSVVAIIIVVKTTTTTTNKQTNNNNTDNEAYSWKDDQLHNSENSDKIAIVYRPMLCTALTMPSHDVYLSVRPSHAGILSKRLNVSSNFFIVAFIHSFNALTVHIKTKLYSL